VRAGTDTSEAEQLCVWM